MFESSIKKKKEEAREIYVPAPPTILSVLPNGVSIASKATLPTVNRLIFIFFSKISKSISDNLIISNLVIKSTRIIPCEFVFLMQ